MSSRWSNIVAKWIDQSRIDELIQWSQQISLPGFSQVPMYDIVAFIYDELKKDDILTRANSVAFSFFLSLFPFIIFVLPLLSLTPWAVSYIEQVEDSINGVIPSSAKTYFLNVVDGIKQEGRGELQVVSFIFSAIFASSGMLTLMYGFDKSYEESFKKRTYIRKRFVALNLTFLLALIFFSSAIIIVMGRQLLNSLIEIFQLSAFASALLVGFKWVIVLVLFYSIITVIYRYGPSTYRPLRLINPGATLATFLSVLASVGFSYFINNFGSYNEIYGSIGALIVILIWLQINAFIVLAGFELNASIIVNRDTNVSIDYDKTN
ncbi:MAG: YihY/virulence factor BrkB family protein [Bacteroidota bacterium]